MQQVMSISATAPRSLSPAETTAAQMSVDIESETVLDDLPSPGANCLTSGGFSIHAACSVAQRQQAQRLVSQRYAQRGYLRMPWRATEEPQLLTLSALGEAGTLGTMGVRLDSNQGLKADEAFPDEMRALRSEGRRLCEFTQLALEHGTISTPVLAGLFHAAHLYAHRIQHADLLIIEVNPRHVGYYRRMLGFTVRSEVRLNPRVNAPAVLMSLDLSFAQQQIWTLGGGRGDAPARSLYPHFFAPDEEAHLLQSLQTQIAPRGN